MAFLEKEILITVNGKTLSHYEHLGYIINKRIDRQGKSRVPSGTKLLVKVEDLPKTSGTIVTKVCDICDKIASKGRYVQIINDRKNGDGKDRCPKCRGVWVSEKIKSKIKYENTLEHYAIQNNREYLINEFSMMNNKKVNEITKSTSDVYWWNCPVCKSEYDTSVRNRTNNNHNCPYCAGSRVNHTNCLWTTHKEVATLLTDPKIGFNITHGQNKNENFTCPKCSFQQNRSVRNIVKRGFSCSRCSDGKSYPEKFILNILQQKQLQFEMEKLFEWSKNKRYDFFIPSLCCIIEVHGEQHYNGGFESLKGRNLNEEIKNDLIKEKLAFENSIKNYIIINARTSSLDWLKNNLESSELSMLLPLDNIEWLKCHEFACSSLVKTVCDLWRDNLRNTKDISRVTGLSISCVINYLKQGAELGWCDYDSREAIKNNAFSNSRKRMRKIVQYTKKGDIIKEWNSINEASKELKINRNCISDSCKGRQKTAGGYKWEYTRK